MKILISVLAVAAISPIAFADTTNEGQPETTESQTLKSRAEQQVNKLNSTAEENAKIISQEITDKYGFRAQCDSGFLGIFDGLKDANCLMGMQSLDNALSKVDPNVDRSELNTVKIELSQAGEWQGATFIDRQIKVPYNAAPARIQEFVNEQMSILFNTSVEELEQSNAKLVSALKEKYNYNVEAAPHLQPAEFHEGLVKLSLAAQKSYGSSEATASEYEKFGFDTIVLAKSYRGLYEDQGQLRVNIDIEEKPGQIFLQLIQQVHPMQSKWRNYVPAYVVQPKLTWSQVKDFRQTRNDVQEETKWLASNYSAKKVECILDNRASHSLSLKECREGLQKLHAAIETYGAPQVKTAGSKILVGDAVVRSNFYVKEDDAVFLSHDSSQKNMYRSIAPVTSRNGYVR